MHMVLEVVTLCLVDVTVCVVLLGVNWLYIVSCSPTIAPKKGEMIRAHCMTRSGLARVRGSCAWSLSRC